MMHKMPSNFNISYRWMDPDEVTRIGEIDRTERIRTGYEYSGSELQQLDVVWDSPPWMAEGDGEYSVAAFIGFCRDHLRRNGRLYGAFDGDQLAGVAIVEERFEGELAWLVFLHVTDPYRRQGVGTALWTRAVDRARSAGRYYYAYQDQPSQKSEPHSCWLYLSNRHLARTGK